MENFRNCWECLLELSHDQCAMQMPILDGSGQFWVEQIAAVGLTPAYKEGDAEEELVRTSALQLGTPG